MYFFIIEVADVYPCTNSRNYSRRKVRHHSAEWTKLRMDEGVCCRVIQLLNKKAKEILEDLITTCYGTHTKHGDSFTALWCPPLSLAPNSLL